MKIVGEGVVRETREGDRITRGTSQGLLHLKEVREGSVVARVRIIAIELVVLKLKCNRVGFEGIWDA